MILCCPHPNPCHDTEGRCTIRHCGCQKISAAVRCSCPYNDCYVLVGSPGEVCIGCGPCVTAHEMDNINR